MTAAQMQAKEARLRDAAAITTDPDKRAELEAEADALRDMVSDDFDDDDDDDSYYDDEDEDDDLDWDDDDDDDTFSIS